jgi:hypothetical protein
VVDNDDGVERSPLNYEALREHPPNSDEMCVIVASWRRRRSSLLWIGGPDDVIDPRIADA